LNFVKLLSTLFFFLFFPGLFCLFTLSNVFLSLLAGEKPFDTIEDLVQDGLIILYMEANHVEEYLQSARETRVTRQASTVGQHGLGHSDKGYHQQYHQGGTRGDEEGEMLGEHAAPPAGVEPGEDDLAGRLRTLDMKAESQRGVSGGGQAPPPKPARLKHYQRCTIPLQRDRTNLLPPDQDEESVKEEDVIPVGGG